MFHHQKSSRSSEENLQINLLHPNQRDSGVHIVRNYHNNVVLNNNKRRSAHNPHPTQPQPQLQPDQNIYDNYSTFQKVDFSQSFLATRNQTNTAVGIVLFVLLVVLTSTETIMLCGSQDILYIQDLLTMGIYLCFCQLIAFGVLYYCHWVQSIKIFIQYLRVRPRPTNQYLSTSPIAYIALRPYLFIPLTLLLTIIWQYCYTYILLNNYQITHLILFYTIILPDIAISIYCQAQLHEQQQQKLRIAFYLILGYLGIVGWIQGGIAIIGVGLIGTALLYLGVRVGRVCLFVQYIAKFIACIVLCILWIVQGTQQPQPQLDFIYPQPKYTNQSPQIHIIIMLTAITTISIISVRCLNSKILRPQLYKYFYSDYTINNTLLCLPAIICYLYYTTIDIWITILGCLILAIISYKLGINQDNVLINNQNQNQNQKKNKNRNKNQKNADQQDNDYDEDNKSQQLNKKRNKRFNFSIFRDRKTRQKISVNKKSRNQPVEMQEISSPSLK